MQRAVVPLCRALLRAGRRVQATRVHSRAPYSTADAAQDWVSRLESALHDEPTGARLRELFAAGGHWRDMVSFTWNIATFSGAGRIAEALDATRGAAAARRWRVSKEPTSDGKMIEAWLDFETVAGVGRGHVRIDVASGKAQTLLTTLQELHAHPFAVGRNRAWGTEHGARRGRVYWHQKDACVQKDDSDPYVLIVGGGQAGLSLGARLSLLGVPYIIVERHPRAGDSWRTRYPSLCLHDPVWYDHMPYMPFPPSWPVFTPRDKMADWLEAYARVMDIRLWTEAEVLRMAPPPTTDRRWEVTISRLGAPPQTLRPRHVVIATGNSGFARTPAFEGAGSFAGEQLHSSTYGGGAACTGKRAVVIGSNTSAHDIAQDLWEQGAASTTMVQRSASLVVSTESILRHGLGPLYSEDAIERGMDHLTADLYATTVPYRLAEQRWREGTVRMRETDRELHESLRAVGFALDFGHDGTGVFGKSARQGGGFYIDVGAASLIASREISLARGSVKRIEREGVVLSSGSSSEITLPADVIIYCTGFGSMHHFVAQLISPSVADAVGRVWGMGAGSDKDPGPWEGELRNMWKPTALPSLWFHGGNLAQCRHYSRYLALQLQARYLDMPTPVYGRPEATQRGDGD